MPCHFIEEAVEIGRTNKSAPAKVDTAELAAS
jgi:hypothetical protein